MRKPPGSKLGLNSWSSLVDRKDDKGQSYLEYSRAVYTDQWSGTFAGGHSVSVSVWEANDWGTLMYWFNSKLGRAGFLSVCQSADTVALQQ